MRKIPFLFIAFLFLVSACHFGGGKRIKGNGVVSTQQRNITDFKGVSVVGNMDVELIPGPAYAVRVEADENLLQYIEIEKEDGILEIGTKRGYNLRPDAGIKIYVTAPAFNRVDVVGGGNVTAQAKLMADNKFRTDVTGSGDVKLDVDAPEVEVQITGSGNVQVAGATRRLNAEITGSGDLRAFDLLSETTDVEISGSGNAQVFASKTLGIEINGSGNIDYKGNPNIKQDIAGSGKIRRVQ